MISISELYNIYRTNPIICTDTRKIEKGCLFFALKGDNFNGNKFAINAIEKGAAYAIIDDPELQSLDNLLLVEDVLTTLQKLAQHHRNQFNIPFIGITGSNGKTTSKELISTVLSEKYKVTATKGNLNNHIGVPLTLLSIPLDCEVAIIEMGANHIGEIDFLCNICSPNFGIITNIGKAHLEGFGGYEGVKKAKSELYQYIKTKNGKIFINNDDELLVSLSHGINSHSYGVSSASCLAALKTSSPTVELIWNNETVTSNLYGTYNFDNILAAICIGDYFKVPHQDIKIAIGSYQSTNNRSQLIQNKSNTIFLDAYNANPTSMNAAIETFKSAINSKKIMFLGDMLELGKASQEEHQRIVKKAYDLNISTIFVGKEFSKVSEKFDFLYLEDYLSAIDWLKNNQPSDTDVLIKGSRGIKLENLVDHF